MERNGLSRSGKGSHEEYCCEMNSKSIYPFGRRSRLKVFLVLVLAELLFTGPELFEQEWLFYFFVLF